MAAFGQLIAQLLAGTAVPLGVLATILLGLVAGQMIYRMKRDILLTTLVTVVISFVGIWLGTQGFVKDIFLSINGGEKPGMLFADIPQDRFIWAFVVMVLCYLGAVLPIWRWAQPINYVAFWIVALGMLGGVLGLLVWHPTIGSDFPAFTSWNGKFEGIPKAAGPLWPLLFVTIACGAISGWHSLVSSSGTARQLERETDALPVGGGAMFLEMILATLSLLTATVGVGAAKFAELSSKGANLGVFSGGLAKFLSKVGIPESFGGPYASVFLVLMGLTIMYLVVRFMRVASAEVLGDRLPIMKNIHVGSFVALLLSFIMILIGLSQGGFAGDFFKRIWVLFGGANQLMAALALLIITLWLMQKGKNYQWTLWPFLFMFVTTIVALILQVIDSFKDLSAEGVTGLLVVGDLIAGGVGILLIVCACILAWDAWQAIQLRRAEGAEAKA
jgi:carbon starvation protein